MKKKESTMSEWIENAYKYIPMKKGERIFMKKNMEIVLYKFEIIKGKESVAEEWLEFLKKNRKFGEELLKKEKAYLEAYFKTIENQVMYVYMFFSAENISFSNNHALDSESELDKKHFKYMKECIDFSKGSIMDCLLYLDNIEDAIM